MSQATDKNEREFDVIVWGASGFTGRLVAEYLLRRYGLGGELRWAIGGRNLDKLSQLRNDLGAAAGIDIQTLPIVVGNADDEASLVPIVRRTRVLCTTVGPYAKYGSSPVAACVRQGTDYCDLTGEVQWMRRMIDQHHAAAQASGARIVFTCGFDCIPADLGVFFLQQKMRAMHGVVSPRIKFRVKGFSGGASGGTIASMLNMLEEADHDRSVLHTLADPYGLNPAGERQGADGSDRVTPVYDAEFEQWSGPFVMAAVDTRVVRRTNALLGYSYGKEFRYDEGVLTGSGPVGWLKAAGTTAGLGGAMAVLRVRALRGLVARRLPSPGEGPSREQREKGYFDIRLWAQHPSDPTKSLYAKVTGDRDPGYGSTSKMLGESAVCLALDGVTTAGGCWTPASAMGEALITRLQANAGLSFQLL